MASTLQDNSEDNPYYEIIHNFLNRQVSLSGNLYFLNSSVKSNVGYLGSKMIVKHPKTRQTVFFNNSFTIDESNKQESLDYLINYFTLSLVAQSFEAFESFKKDLYRKSLSLSIKNEAVLKITSKNVRTIKNLEVIKILGSIYPSLVEIFDEDNRSWIQKIETIRHCIVHADQTVDQQTIKETKHQFVDCYFYFTPIPGSDRYRIGTLGEHAKEVLKAFQGLAFSTFVLVSEDDGYAVLMTSN